MWNPLEVVLADTRRGAHYYLGKRTLIANCSQSNQATVHRN